MKTFKLLNGELIPQIAFGPGIPGYNAKLNPLSENIIFNIFQRAYNKYIKTPRINSSYVNTIANAFRIGYTLLDHSSSYGDSHLIHDAIKKSGIPRTNLYLTTRISNGAQMRHGVRHEFFEILKALGTDYVELLQFHWPVTDVYVETWREMIKLKEEGYVKTIGVANCHQHHIEKLISETGIMPLVNQVEIHPLFTQKPLIQYCKEKGIQMEAYSPIARMDDRLVRLPVLNNIAKKYNKTLVQIVYRWNIQNGIIPIINSHHIKRLKQSLEIFDFELTKEEMSQIDGININARVRYDPDNCDFSIL